MRLKNKAKREREKKTMVKSYSTYRFGFGNIIPGSRKQRSTHIITIRYILLFLYRPFSQTVSFELYCVFFFVRSISGLTAKTITSAPTYLSHKFILAMLLCIFIHFMLMPRCIFFLTSLFCSCCDQIQIIYDRIAQ